MSTPKRFFQSTQNLFQPIWRLGRAIVRGFMNRLLRVLVGRLGHPSRLTQAGFVLPTVVMVMLVVTLLTTAIVFRSFDRAKNASNFRVNQAVLNAATPAIARAKAKIEALMADPNLPQGTPSEISIENVLEKAKYTLGDEDRIQLQDAVETLTTAWRFPVDTDNNGEVDSISLYGIYFRNPQTSSEKRTPLDARTPPMTEGESNAACAQAVGTSASLVGTNGWYKVKGDLKKAFFVYVATVPITDTNNIGIQNAEKYSRGNQGFSALEYQQDIARIPLSNNAIVYDDDLEMASGPDFFVNGRIFTNSNLLVRESDTGNTVFRQVSSPASCFYEAENGKIVVGGNYVSGNTHISDTSEIETHLFQEGATPNTGAKLTGDNGSVPSADPGSKAVAYNNEAYNQRIKYLVDQAWKKSPDPAEVTEKSEALQDDPTNPLPADKARRQALEIYFRNRTRRVPYAEVARGGDAVAGASLLGSGDTLRPSKEWIFPFDTNTTTGTATLTSNTGLALNGTIPLLEPKATEFELQQEQGNESLIGDRVLIGNNLPALWYKDGQFVGNDELQAIEETEWNAPKGEGPRQRKTRVRQLDNLDTIARDGFWEIKAAEQPKNLLDGVGGLRVVTGAGVYLPFNDDISVAADPSHVVWPDTMPVIDYLATTPPAWMPDSLKDGAKFPIDVHPTKKRSRPYLKMRASAVYHYTHEDGKEPIACINNYYDPTDSTTADPNRDDDGDSIADNGQVYGPPERLDSPALEYQADLLYPNGRPVNQLLKDALAKAEAERTLAEQAAVDSTLCALQIYDTLQTATTSLGSVGSLGTVPTDYDLVDGAIKETAFLDARQVKLIDKDYDPAANPKDSTAAPVDPLEVVSAPGYSTLKGNYDLPIEQRYPLEVRATVIDLNLLRNNTAAGGLSQEYMLPNSGIIYATRDDALPDASNPGGNSLSATDFLLDPTRRPNGIMVINGEKLGRTQTFRAEEKGLILASNLPVYVRGNFNIHTHKEFDDNSNVSFYDRSTLNQSFACRPGDTRIPCPNGGDEWRPATILSDAVTVLSANFREGVRVEGDYDLRNNQIDSVASPDARNINAEIEGASVIEGKRKAQGFWNNNFVTNGLSSKGYRFRADSIRLGLPASDVTPTDEFYSKTTPANQPNVINSSYFNNFITPIQRRVEAPEYVMEICRKLPVSECTVDDWVVGYDIDGGGLSPVEANIKASNLEKYLKANTTIDPLDPNSFNPTLLGAGTTTRPAPLEDDRRFPRRVAFLRYGDVVVDRTIVAGGGQLNSEVPNTLVLHSKLSTGTPPADPVDQNAWTPVAIGIEGTNDSADANPDKGSLKYYPANATLNINGNPYSQYADPSNRPRLRGNTLWYGIRIRVGGNAGKIAFNTLHPLAYLNGLTNVVGEQPLLIPVLQLQYPTAAKVGNLPTLHGGNNEANQKTNWLPRAEVGTTTTNMIVATGDTPSRPPFSTHEGDFSGGVPNLVRAIENWNWNAPGQLRTTISEISGSFIQIKRSEYATAPYFHLPNTTNNGIASLFTFPQDYSTQNAQGKVPYFEPPKREWGFDVGILSQLPDLFAQQFTLPPTEPPNEFFREVSRDDDWVQTLLCGEVVRVDNDGQIIRDANKKPQTDGNAINDNQRPNSCT